MDITTKQRAFLRGLANKIDATFQIGKGGINENMVTTAKNALEKNELVKFHVLENCFDDVRGVCDEMAERTGAVGVQVIGRRFVLYKPSAENRRIDLKNLVVREPKQPAKTVKPLYKAKENARRKRKEKRIFQKKALQNRFSGGITFESRHIRRNVRPRSRGTYCYGAVCQRCF